MPSVSASTKKGSEQLQGFISVMQILKKSDQITCKYRLLD